MDTYSEIKRAAYDTEIMICVYNDPHKRTFETRVGHERLICPIIVNDASFYCREMALKDYKPCEPVIIEPSYIIHRKGDIPPIELFTARTEKFLEKYLIGIKATDIKPMLQAGNFRKFIIPGHKNRYIVFHNILIARLALFYNMIMEYHKFHNFYLPYQEDLNHDIASQLYNSFESSINAICTLINKYGQNFEEGIFLTGYTVEKSDKYANMSDLNMLIEFPIVNRAYKSMFSTYAKIRKTKNVIENNSTIVEEDDTKAVIKIPLKSINCRYNKNSYAYFEFEKEHPAESYTDATRRICQSIFLISNYLKKIEYNARDYKIRWNKENSNTPYPLQYNIPTGVLMLSWLTRNWQDE